MAFKRVSRHYADPTKDVASNNMIQVKEFESEVGSVTASYEVVVPLTEPKYSSIRVVCSVTLPCYPEEVKNAAKSAWKMAADEVCKQIAMVKEDDGVVRELRK